VKSAAHYYHQKLRAAMRGYAMSYRERQAGGVLDIETTQPHPTEPRKYTNREFYLDLATTYRNLANEWSRRL